MVYENNKMASFYEVGCLQGKMIDNIYLLGKENLYISIPIIILVLIFAYWFWNKFLIGDR